MNYIKLTQLPPGALYCKVTLQTEISCGPLLALSSHWRTLQCSRSTKQTRKHKQIILKMFCLFVFFQILYNNIKLQTPS